MEERKTACGYSVLRRAVLMVFLLMFMAVVSPLFIRLGSNGQGRTVSLGQISFESVDVHTMAETIRYIPRSVVDTWAQRDYLVVFGIPSVDLEGRRRRRYLQRTTCWRFPGVATKANNFTGEMLVLYVLARHPSHGYNYSAAVQKEAAEWHDLLTLPINEGRPSTNKVIGGNGSWGIEAEFGMSRKTFMWFHHALQLFPNVSYMGKGDDDMFLRVPQYLVDLRTLPRRGLYWGLRDFSNVGYIYVSGFCSTLARDVVEHVVSYKPVRTLVYNPYCITRKELLLRDMHHEDVMVAQIIHKTMRRNVVYAGEKPCHFHDVHVGFRVRPVTSQSVVVHHLWESEYAELMERFGNDTSPSPRRIRHGSRCFIGFPCAR